MPKGQLEFPSRADRKKLLEEIRNTIKENPEAAADQLFKEYAESLEALDKKMDALSATDENGIPKYLTAEDAEDLKKDLVDTAQRGEFYIASQMFQNKDLTTGVPGMVNNLQGLMSKDFDALNTYDPAQKKSLPELQESTRCQTIDLRDRNLGSMGNMQNQRIPMTVVNSKGEKRRGVYTKGKYLTVKKDFDKLIEEAKAKCQTQEQRDELDQFFPKYRQSLIGNLDRNGKTIDNTYDDAFFVGYLGYDMSGMYPNKLTNTDVKAVLAMGGINFEIIPKAALNVLNKGFNKMKADIGLEINTTRLEIREGERIDNRNSALSAVAGLLGCSNTVAKSENMRFIGEDGKVTEGTFMEYADGVNIAERPWLFEHVRPNAFGDEANRNKLFKQIADLQIVDYLCLNEDRHQGNLMYDIDDDGILRGIKAIDNDSTFGLSKSGAIKRSDLRVISKTMYDTITKMTPEMYKFSLRGRGLSEAQMDASVQRFRLLKKDLLSDKKPIKVVDDNKFGKLNIDHLKPTSPKRNNLFSKIDTLFTTTSRNYRDMDWKFTPMPKEEKDLKEVSTTSRRGTVGGLTDALESMSRRVENKETGFKVDDLTTFFRGSSPQFKNMVTAAKEAQTLLNQLKEDKKLDMTKLAEEDPETYDKVCNAFSKIKEANNEYLVGKMKERGVTTLEALTGKNDYEQKRIDYAMDVRKTVNEFNTMMSGPASKDEVDDLQANKQRRQLEDNRKAAEQQNPILM